MTRANRRIGLAIGAEKGGIYDKFWEQVVDWSLRPTESSRMQMITEYRDGKIHVTVDAHGNGDPDVGLTLRGGITTPNPGGGEEGGKKRELRFVQTNSGRYEATVDAEESGSYFVNAQAVRMVKIRNKDGKEVDAEEGVDSVPRWRDAAVFAGVFRAGSEYNAPGENRGDHGRQVLRRR